jgi:hypothetical protein
MISKEDIQRIKSGSSEDKEHELQWFADGKNKPPISILGRNKKLMLMTLAILQAPINTYKCKVTGLKRTIDLNKKPFQINI